VRLEEMGVLLFWGEGGMLMGILMLREGRWLWRGGRMSESMWRRARWSWFEDTDFGVLAIWNEEGMVFSNSPTAYLQNEIPGVWSCRNQSIRCRDAKFRRTEIVERLSAS
jgi:hypothetical protein